MTRSKTVPLSNCIQRELEMQRRSIGRNFLLAFVFAFLFSPVQGQYFQFSQYNFTSQRINPATIGTTRYATLDVDSRNQKTGGDFNINSNFFSVSYPLLNQSTGLPWAGIGFSAVDDRSGGIFKTQEIAASYALNVRLNRYQLLSFGMKGLYQSSQLSMDGFYTGSQYVPDRGFSNSMSSGEAFQEARTHYATFSAGLYWHENDRRGNTTGYWGISLFDINKPQYSFTGTPTQLSSTFVFTGGFQAYRKNEIVIFPEMLYTRSSANNTLNAGIRFQYNLKAMPNQTGARVDLITKYVVGRSGIVGLQLHRENFSAGISYDFPLLTANPGNLGALEIGLSLRKLVVPKMRRIAIRKQEEKKKALARIPPAKKAATKLNPTPDTSDTLSGKAAIIPEVEIAKADSVSAKTEASAGKISQEPIVVEKITLHFHFEYNSIDLDDETEDFLTGLSTTLSEDKNLKVKITGHTDNIGPEKFNQKLSIKRAEAIRRFLLKKGIESQRMEADGKGLTEPLNNNETEDDRAKNRRVEILLYHDN